MELRSERGTVTAELAIALPSVLLVLSFALQVLSIQVERIGLVGEVAQLARAAARGEAIAETTIEGSNICVTRSRELLIPIKEKQCARRLGM